MIAVRDSVAFTLHKEIVDPQVNYLILVCVINSTTYTVANIYAPNMHQIRFLHKVLKKIRTAQQGSLIICGDFNLTWDPALDSTLKSRRPTQSLQSLMHAHDLYDAWQCLHANERDYTLFSSSHQSYSRIDQFLIDKGLLTKIKKLVINDITWSDHASVTMEVGDSASINPTYRML